MLSPNRAGVTNEQEILMASDMEAGDWGNIIAEIFSGFSFGGEKGGEPDWKAIEPLLN